MNISLNDIESNLKNNKIYLERDTIKVNHITYPTKSSIFKNILLNNLFNYKKKTTIQNTLTAEYNNKTSEKIQTQLKYKKNTFINELINCLYERALLENPCLREFKVKFVEYVNNIETREYLKTCTRSYKKLQFKLNEVLNVDNIDDQINDFPELIKLICKKFNINILIIYDNIYKLYENENKDTIYLIFNKVSVKYKDSYRKIYKFTDEYNGKNNNISNILENKNKYYNEKELSKLKLDELKLIGKDFKIFNSKKKEIINHILEICCNFY